MACRNGNAGARAVTKGKFIAAGIGVCYNRLRKSDEIKSGKEIENDSK